MTLSRESELKLLAEGYNYVMWMYFYGFLYATVSLIKFKILFVSTCMDID